MSGVAKQPPSSARGRAATTSARSRPSSGPRSGSSTAPGPRPSTTARNPGSPKPTATSAKTKTKEQGTSAKSLMSKSMVATASTSLSTSVSKPKTASRTTPKIDNNPMTKSLHESSSVSKSATKAKPSHCNVENGRQDAAEADKAKKATPKAAVRSKAPKPILKKPPASQPKPVDHSDPEDAEEDADIHPALLKQTRKSGSLNLSGRGLTVIPSKVWSLNEDVEKPKGIFMDKVEEDNWWERVDLTKLILASNQISKVSSKIKKLDTLQILDLHDNNISLLPEDMGALEQLNRLNLSHNKLNFLPLGFYSLKSLRVLNLNHNELNEINEDIGSLDMLNDLDLAHNKIMELPNTIGHLTKVTNFNVSHNNLETLPTDISFMRSVTCLELSHNNLVSVTDTLQELHNLERLYLQHNKLKTMPVLKNCQHLKEVYLGFNQIEELTDVDLENMPNIKMIDLRENKIPLLPDEIINLQGLERLDVSNNDLATLPFSLGTLPHLKSLQVDGNPMRGIRRDIIARGTQGLLKYLKSRIDDDELTRLRDKGQVSPVPTLGTDSPPVPDKFVMKTAQTMNLTGKELTFLPKEAVENALEAEVTGVDLSKNYFKEFPTNLEPLMGQLHELNLSSNRLEKLPASMMSLGTYLQFINLSNNRLAQLPPEVGLLANLREICLNINKFDAVPTCLYGCSRLETIMIADNRVSQIDVDGLKQLSKLSILDLGNNNIGQVPPELGLLTNLRVLTLDGNAFRVPRPQILVKGTASIMAYLRDRIPRSAQSDDQQQSSS